MAPTTHHQRSLKAKLPGLPHLMLAGGVAGWCVILATGAMAVQFQLVDWRVESRDMQRQLREAETRAAELESSLAYWQRADYLKGSAAEVLALQPLQPEQAEQFKIDPSRLKRWEAAISDAASSRQASGQHARAPEGIIGLSKMIAEKEGDSLRSRRKSSQATEAPTAQAAPTDNKVSISENSPQKEDSPTP